ncbi:hypothetical protein [Sulfurimonas autotrophica]|uniref:Uncharacterized protein n=1 Tax=Sulfurimonas autotrophica (strain ATCC BAA-671 / DSM 16294 / JCM 11897 / OK10) TaxID=563040 RepID=E0UPC1_SULAO|nr:hypothetical protein [Sulfurimonas autotrophica]ADN08585.1 hypothetical protein Saut_0536 [Sulfurimonas autotrophica DSM 16294]
MKFTKMSLVAALLIGSSAFAIENTKVSGDANLFYNTTDAGSNSLFDKDNSAADTAINLNVTTDLIKNSTVAVSAGAGYTVLSTLGLEQNLVSSVWGGAHGIKGNSSSRGAHVSTPNWMTEAWLAATAGKTTAKIGRMELDTPLAFTETWTIEKNTFEAAVVINQDVPDTTLVGAYVGNGNGTESLGGSTMPQGPVAMGAVVNQDGAFDTYGKSGAYAIGVVNNSFKPLTAQAWYYNVTAVADAYWLQADLDAGSLGAEGLTAGVQYTSVKSVASGAKADNVYAVKLGYEMKDLFAASIAYSSVNDNGTIGYAGFNTATAAGTAQSKLYTEAWWNYGKITQTDTDAYNITITSPVQGLFDLGLYYTDADQTAAAGDNDMTEFTLTAGKSFGPLDATLAYIYSDVKTATVGDDETTNAIQAYLTLNF